MSRRFALALAACAVALLGLFLLHLLSGSVAIPAGETIRALFGASGVAESVRTIVLEFRLPRAIVAIVAGAGLATGGLLMQTLFRNPLAGPFVLGINAGASLGVALVILGGTLLGNRIVAGSGLLSGVGLAGDALILLAAAAGSAAVLLAVLAVARRVESAMTLLVLGVLFSYAVSAGVSVLMQFSIPEEIQSYINWGFGSFGGVNRQQLPLFAGVVAGGLALTLLLVKPLNALLLGETYAVSMGVHVRVVRIVIIAVTALVAGTVTAFCGPIGFVGVAVPHLARALIRDADHRRLMPLSLLLGAIVATVADIAASLPGLRIALPLNAMTALIGAPVVIAVILRRGDLSGGFG